jgi:hypothetical protein
MIDDRDIIINQGRRGGGRGILRALLPLAYLIALLLLLLAFQGFLARIDPAETDRRRAEAFAAQERAARLWWVQDATAVAWGFIPPALVLGVGIVGLLALYNRLARWQGVQADKVAQLVRADRQQLPASLQTLNYHHAPRLDYKPVATAPAELDAPDLEEENAETPTMADLIARGRVGRGNPLILGFEEGKELSGSWLDLYATITAGLPGTGKTTTQRFFAIQTALHGARFAVADPHAGAADDSLAATLDPLRACYLCEPASDPRKILELVRYVADLGERRIQGRDRDRTPVILWLDELTGLLGRSDVGPEMAELLERIAQEYRKRWVYLSASGQIWTAARTTSELRDSFASVLCHRMKRSQARLLLPTEEAALVERLPTGSAVLWRTSGATSIVRIPNTTIQDVASVAGYLAGDMQPAGALPAHGRETSPRSAPEGLWTPSGREKDAAREETYSTSESHKPASAEAARAAALFLGGQDPAAIVLELRSVKSSDGGRKYQRALAEILALVREGIRAGSAH